MLSVLLCIIASLCVSVTIIYKSIPKYELRINNVSEPITTAYSKRGLFNDDFKKYIYNNYKNIDYCHGTLYELQDGTFAAIKDRVLIGKLNKPVHRQIRIRKLIKKYN